MSVVKQISRDGGALFAMIAGVDPITTWVSVEHQDLRSYEVLVVRDENNSEIGAVIVLDRERQGDRWSAAQFDLVDFDEDLRDGDPVGLAVAAVELLRAEDASRG